MTPYQTNKTISIGIPMLILFGALLCTDINNPSLWWLLIVITHTLGYTHFILGFIYQRRSLKRKQNAQLLRWFYLLTIGAIAFSALFIFSDNTPLLAIFAVGYFIVHGTSNEFTQIKELIGYAPEAKLFLPLIFYLTAFFLLSLTHPSFFFTPKLEFLNPPPEIAVQLLNSIVSFDIVSIGALFLMLLFVICIPVRLFLRGNLFMSVGIFLVTVCTFYFFWEVKPLNYVVLYFIALSYHFISWGVFLYQRFKRTAPERIPKYAKDHLYVFLPFVAVSIVSIFWPNELGSLHPIFFNGIIFITFAMIHNTTSFLNETWFISWLKKYEK